MTWAVLLGRWIEFARGALALPDDGAGLALRRSVPDIITLQAVWFALQHLDELEHDQRALGVARAQVLIERHERSIQSCWRDEAKPDELNSLIADARAALAKASSALADHPAGPARD